MNAAGPWRVERLVNGRWWLAYSGDEIAAESYYRSRAPAICTGAMQLVRPDGVTVASTWCTRGRAA